MLMNGIQVRRVQKYVETLDILKVKNSMPSSNGGHIPKQAQSQRQSNSYGNGRILAPIQEHQPRHSLGSLPTHQQQGQKQQQPSSHSTSGPVVVTTQWETFDNMPPLIPISSSSSSTSATNGSVHPKFNWESFE